MVTHLKAKPRGSDTRATGRFDGLPDRSPRTRSSAGRAIGRVRSTLAALSVGGCGAARGGAAGRGGPEGGDVVPVSAERVALHRGGLRTLAPLLCRFGEPGGFQGAVLVAVDLDTHGAASPESVELPQGGHLHISAAFLPAAPLPHSYEHAFAAELEVLCMRVVVMEGCHPLAEEFPHPLVSSIDAHVWDPRLGHVPLNVGVVEIEHGLHVSPLPGLPRPADDLHTVVRLRYSLRPRAGLAVLGHHVHIVPRHRPPSIRRSTRRVQDWP